MQVQAEKNCLINHKFNLIMAIYSSHKLKTLARIFLNNKPKMVISHICNNHIVNTKSMLNKLLIVNNNSLMANKPLMDNSDNSPMVNFSSFKVIKNNLLVKDSNLSLDLHKNLTKYNRVLRCGSICHNK